MQEADSRMTASVGLRIFGSGTSSQRTSRDPWRTVPNIFALPEVQADRIAPPAFPGANIRDATIAR